MAREKAPLWDRTTYVYRAFTPSGVLLYVGISDKWITRLRGHSNDSAWWPYTAYLQIDEYANRAEAFAAESWAITHEAPACNVELQTVHCPDFLPVPLCSFGRRQSHWTWNGDEIPVRDVKDGVLWQF